MRGGVAAAEEEEEDMVNGILDDRRGGGRRKDRDGERARWADENIGRSRRRTLPSFLLRRMRGSNIQL